MPHPAPKVKRSSLVLAKLILETNGKGGNFQKKQINMDTE
jgi:hypothetical protein